MLQKVKFQPGFNKQVTSTGGESQWVNGDNVRFRYGTPEKIGGWSQLGSVQITGRATAIHHFVNTSGIKYAVLGTNRILYAYSGGIFYDIHPIKATTTLTSAFSTTNGSKVVTLTFSSSGASTSFDTPYSYTQSEPITAYEEAIPPGLGRYSSDLNGSYVLILSLIHI